MFDEGFDYATFAPRYALDFPLRPSVGVGFKPKDTIFFTILEPAANARPAWHRWCLYQDYHIDHYAAQPIAFAAFHSQRLAPQSLPGFAVGHGTYLADRAYQTDWDAVRADGWAGVDVAHPLRSRLWQLAAWDVPTVAVWDKPAIAELLVFENAGRWLYAPEPENVQC